MAKTCFSSIFAALILVFIAPISVQAADLTTPSEKYYGQGVHALNAGNYFDAIESFDSAESMGSRDPRCYFLRGVAHLRSGDSIKADADLKKAAELEWSERAIGYNIGEALRRIQGNERVKIESYRKAAKAKWEQEESQRQTQRYGREREENRKILDGILAPAPAQVVQVGNIAPEGGDELQLGIVAVQPITGSLNDRYQKQLARQRYQALQAEIRGGLEELFTTADGRITQAQREKESQLEAIRKQRREEAERNRIYDPNAIIGEESGGGYDPLDFGPARGPSDFSVEDDPDHGFNFE